MAWSIYRGEGQYLFQHIVQWKVTESKKRNVQGGCGRINYLLPMPTAFLAWSRRESWRYLNVIQAMNSDLSCERLTLLPLEELVIESPIFWLPDFWLCSINRFRKRVCWKAEELTLGCTEDAILSMDPLILSPACSNVPFWESGFMADPALSVKDWREASDILWIWSRGCVVSKKMYRMEYERTGWLWVSLKVVWVSTGMEICLNSWPAL